VLATRGLAALFGTLSEDLARRDHALERYWRTSRTCDLSLNGQGLLILPSALWTGPPLFCIHPEESGGSALIYPVRSALAAPGPGEVATLPGYSGGPGQRLFRHSAHVGALSSLPR
jgi:hypothetical protein